MGCCFSNSDDKSQTGEPNERTTLLGNPVSNNLNRPIFRYCESYSSEVLPNQIGDEQAALSRILHQTACDIIDVSAIPTHLERKEYTDRVQLYRQRLHNLQLQHTPMKQSLLLLDLPFTEANLAENQLLLADHRLMNEALGNISQALKDVKIEPQADLVAQFGVS